MFFSFLAVFFSRSHTHTHTHTHTHAHTTRREIEALGRRSGIQHSLFTLLPHARLKVAHVTVSATCLGLLAEADGLGLEGHPPQDRPLAAWDHFFHLEKIRSLRPAWDLRLNSWRTDGVSCSFLFHRRQAPLMAQVVATEGPGAQTVLLPPALYDMREIEDRARVMALLGDKPPHGLLGCDPGEGTESCALCLQKRLSSHILIGL